jgi:hypothetical protein
MWACVASGRFDGSEERGVASELIAVSAVGRSAAFERAHVLLSDVQRLRDEMGLEAAEQLAAWRPRIEGRSFLLSAHNLAAYLALRRRDLRELQLAMMPFGLSAGTVVHASDLEGGDLGTVHAPLPVLVGETFSRSTRGRLTRSFRCFATLTAGQSGSRFVPWCFCRDREFGPSS